MRADRRLEGGGGEHAARTLDDRHHRSGQRGRRAALEPQGMRVAPQQDLVPARPDVEPDRDLVAHRPGREEHGRLVAEERGDALLEGERRRVRAPLLVTDLRLGHGPAHAVGRARLRV
jgi:hypothetical protein